MMTMDTRAMSHIFARTDKYQKTSVMRKSIISFVGGGMCISIMIMLVHGWSKLTGTGDEVSLLPRTKIINDRYVSYEIRCGCF